MDKRRLRKEKMWGGEGEDEGLRKGEKGVKVEKVIIMN